MNHRLAAAGVAAVLLLAGCGNTDGNGHDEHSGPQTGAGSGQPGDPAQARRTIDVAMKDTLQFDPSMVQVKQGETVTFRIANTGKVVHEFTLGDEQVQKDHDQEMQGMTGGMSDEPNGRSVEPGQTEDLTWTFPDQAATVLYGCHIPGHYSGGMKGTITVA